MSLPLQMFLPAIIVGGPSQFSTSFSRLAQLAAPEEVGLDAKLDVHNRIPAIELHTFPYWVVHSSLFPDGVSISRTYRQSSLVSSFHRVASMFIGACLEVNNYIYSSTSVPQGFLLDKAIQPTTLTKVTGYNGENEGFYGACNPQAAAACLSLNS